MPESIKLPIYMDYQATTPTDPRVVEAMLPYFSEKFGNPHSAGHAFGWEADEAATIAREQVAGLIGADAREVIFTSGATESNNLAIKGIARFHAAEGGAKRHIITLATEHKCVLAACEALQQEGFTTTVLPVQPDGLLDIALLEEALKAQETLLVSVMAVNNEIGVIQPLAQIGALCRAHGALFHCDAAQGFGKIPLDVEAMHIDTLAISGHKAYAPKGIGALYVRRRPRVRVAPLFSGGGQERGLRSGTVPVPLTVGLGKAAEIAGEHMEEETTRLLALRQRFLDKLQPLSAQFCINGHEHQRIAGNLSLSFPHIPEDKMLRALNGLAVSTGSACSSGVAGGSYVLRTLGAGKAREKTAIRFGFGRFTTEEKVDYAAGLVVKALRVLAE